MKIGVGEHCSLFEASPSPMMQGDEAQGRSILQSWRTCAAVIICFYPDSVLSASGIAKMPFHGYLSPVRGEYLKRLKSILPVLLLAGLAASASAQSVSSLYKQGKK